jgi:hypothetical protein
MTDIKGIVTFRIGIRAYYDDDGSVIPRAGGIRINISGYPYTTDDTLVALIAEGSASFDERYGNRMVDECEDEELIIADSTLLEEDEVNREEENPEFDPHSLIGHIVPVFIDEDGDVIEPVWQDYHKKISEDMSLRGYSYLEFHLGGFSFTRDQVHPVDIDADLEEKESMEEEPDPGEAGENETGETEKEDALDIMPSASEETSAFRYAGSLLADTWFMAAGIGLILASLASLALIGMVVYHKRK